MVSAREMIARIVQDMLVRRKINAVVGPEQRLHDVGLTSLDMVNLMLAVEETFEIEVPQKKMTPDNFRSIAAIETLVRGLMVQA